MSFGDNFGGYIEIDHSDGPVKCSVPSSKFYYVVEYESAGRKADHFITIGSENDRFLTPARNMSYRTFHQINTTQRFSRFAWLTGDDPEP